MEQEILKEIKIKCRAIKEGQFSNEKTVSFVNKDGVILTGIFPDDNIKDNHLRAWIIRETENAYLVRLPDATFTTGSKVWLSKDMVIEVTGEGIADHETEQDSHE